MKTKSELSLLCRVRDVRCALPLIHVIETMRPMRVERITGMPSFIQGVAIIRGVPTPVVDAGALLRGGASTEVSRFVTVTAVNRQVALAVDAVEGIRALDSPLGALPPLFLDRSFDVLASIDSVEAELVLVLRSARLVPDEVWRVMEIDSRRSA